METVVVRLQEEEMQCKMALELVVLVLVVLVLMELVELMGLMEQLQVAMLNCGWYEDFEAARIWNEADWKFPLVGEKCR